jgi:hypothetical protein
MGEVDDDDDDERGGEGISGYWVLLWEEEGAIR